WESAQGVVQAPERVVEEWTRRGAEDGVLAQARAQRGEAQCLLAAQEQTLRRLQDAYEAGALTVEELTVRSERVRARIRRAKEELAQAQAHLTQAVEIKALAGKLTAFADQVRSGLERLDWHQRRQLIRTLVSRVEINEDGATVVYRIPATPRRPGEPPRDSGPEGEGPSGERPGDRQLRPGCEATVAGGARAAVPLEDDGLDRRPGAVGGLTRAALAAAVGTAVGVDGVPVVAVFTRVAHAVAAARKPAVVAAVAAHEIAVVTVLARIDDPIATAWGYREDPLAERVADRPVRRV